MINPDYYEDLITAFIKATPSVEESRLLEAGEERSDGERKQPEEKFTDIVIGTRYQLDRHYPERLHQAHITFVGTCAAFVVGILLVFGGVILTFTISLPIGSLTAVSGVVVNILGTVTLNFYKDANDRLDRLRRELSLTESTLVLVDHISDLKARDEAITDLIRRLSSPDFNATTSLTPQNSSKK